MASSVPSCSATVIALRTITLLVIALAAAVGKAQPFPAGDELPFELYMIEAAGGGLHKLIDTPGFTCGSPDWSLDGKSIAFDTWRVGQTFNDSQIAIIRADGSNLHIIGPGGMPSFSPDGTQLVCHTYDNPQTIVVMNTDGRGREVVTNHWGSPRWSPRGNRIASLDSKSQICLFDLATGFERSILPGPYGGTSYHYVAQIGIDIAPDGHRFAFGASDGLFLATLDEQTMQTSLLWPVKGGIVRCCSWSPDGKRVVFGWKKTSAASEQIFAFDVDSSNPPTWLPGQDPKRANACPDWSPDGKTIVFVSQVPPDTFETKIPQVGATKP